MRWDRIGKRCVSAACCFLLAIGLCPAKASAAPEVSASAAAVVEGSTGRVLWSKNGGAAMTMASTTKILTALLTLEAGNLDEPFIVDSNAIMVEGSSMGLQKGDQVTLRTLACGMLLSSGNDAANAAAVRIAGSIPEFAVLMNERAAQLGMENSSFVTPSGLDAEGHYSTALDMAKLAAAALQNEDFREICSQTSMKVQFGSPPADRWLKNHNKLLESFDGCIGVKTGFTKLSGRCLVSAAERDGVAICCVTLKDPDDWLDHQKLLEWGFGQVEKVDLQADLSAVKVPVTGGVLKGVSVRQAEAASVVVPAGSGQFTQTLYLPQFAYAPVRAGDTLGEVRWYTGEGAERRLAASAPLIAEETSEIDPTLETPWRKRFFLWKLFS